jgi:hypothetical protein
MPLVQKAEELIKATPLRMKLRRASEMPLAHQSRRIARVTQSIRNGLLRDWQANARRGVLRADGIKLKTEASLKTPGHQRRTRGRAKRRGDIAARESRPTRRECIDLRCRNVFPAIATEFAVTEIVNDDEDDIGFSCRPRCISSV